MPFQRDHATVENRSNMLNRMLKAARLDKEIFLVLKQDDKATTEALGVVILTGVCYGLGFSLFIGAGLFGALLGATVGAAAGILVAFVWLSLTFLVGTRLFGGVADYWGLARPFFFSWSPGVLFLLTSVPIPLFSQVAGGVATGWIVVASVVAVKNSTGLDNQRSLLTFILTFFLMATAYGLVVSL